MMRHHRARNLLSFLTAALLVASCAKDAQHTVADAAAGAGGGSSTGSTITLNPVTCGGLPVTSAMQVWLDAGNLSLANGSGVTTWNDCLNSSFSVTQATAAKKPIYAASGGPGNLPYVSFDGVQQYLAGATAGITFTSGLSAIFLISFADYTGDGLTHGLIVDDLFNTGFTINVYGDTASNSLTPSIAASGSTNIGSGSYAGNTWYLVAMVLNPAGKSIVEYQNGVPTGYDVMVNNNTFTANGPTLGLFTNGGHTKFTTGKLAELMLYNSSLSDSDLATVTCYMSKKYNLALSSCD